MNIDQARQHYGALLTDLRGITCEGKTLTWSVDRPERTVATGTIGSDGNASAYTYNSEMLVARASCNRTSEEWHDVVDQIATIINDHGRVTDDTVVADGLGSQGAEARWRDEFGSTIVFSTGMASTLSIEGAEFPRG